MKLVVQARLFPTPAQAAELDATLRTCNRVADEASAVAFERRVFRQYPLRGICYGPARAAGLGAQVAQLAIKKATDSYKVDRKVRHRFHPLASQAFDDRCLSWRLDASDVSIWTTAGRAHIPFVASEAQRNLLARRRGESDLVFRDGRWYLYATCEVEVPEPIAPGGWLGVDLGVVNIAATSDGEVVTGRGVNRVRARNNALRKKLQAKKTKSAKRLLKKRSRRESRFCRDANHKIARRLIREAERTGRGIALEDLVGIRSRARSRKPQRRMLHSWSFAQLRAFVTYKAALAGVPVVVVEPRNTSRRCPMCHYTSKRNRPRQGRFCCRVCGLAGHADVIAAVNVAFLGACHGWAEVTQPYAGPNRATVHGGAHETSSPGEVICKPGPSGLGR